MAAIDTLPVIQSPEMFGLHANADISYYTSAAKAMWADLVALQPRTGGAGSGAPPPPATPFTRHPHMFDTFLIN